MKVLIGILKIIINFILTLAICLVLVTNIATSTILNKEYVLNKFEETGYYENAKKDLESNFENYIYQSGFDENVINDIVTEDMIKRDTMSIITNIYDGKEIEIDTTTLEQNLRTNIEKSLENPKLNITQKDAIDRYVDLIIDKYKSTIFKTTYEADAHNVIVKVNKYVEYARKASIITIAVTLILILLINAKNIIKAISQIGISLVSSGLLFIIANIYINTKIKISNLIIFGESISKVIRQILTNILQNIATYGTIMLLCGTLLIIIGNLSLRKKHHRHKYKEEVNKK